MGSSGLWASRFEQEGYLGSIQVLEAPEADTVRRQFDALETAEGRTICQIGLLDRHFDQQFVWDLATNERVLDAVESVLGPDVMLLASHFFCKYPAEGDEGRARRDAARYVAWHQDVTYWGLEPPESVTAWYAVDDSDQENGCMRVIPRTHHTGIREHGKASRAGNLLSINQEVPVTAKEEGSAVDLVLRAGEISLHHGMVVHGSNPNRSRRRRCGLTLRYITPAVRQVQLNSQGRGYAAVLVRGQDRFHHFEERLWPF